MLDFTIAKMNHQLWKRKLGKFINGDSGMDEKELVSERDCKLGQWLYSEGINKYSSLGEIHNLETVHKELHQLTFSIVDQKKKGNTGEASALLEQLGEKSEIIVQLLDRLEIKMKSDPASA